MSEGRNPAARLVRAAPAIVAALVIAAVPYAVGNAFVVGKVLSFVGINVIVVTGLALLFGYGGQVSLGHAAFYGIGAYASAYVTTTLKMPWAAGIAAAMVLSALGGLVLSFPGLRLKGHYLAMATLGFGEIMAVAFVELREITGGTNGLSGIAPAEVASLRFASPAANYWLVWAVAGIGLLVARNITTSRPGRALRAMHGSEMGAMACGIDLTRLKVQVFVISAVMAGTAGALYAHLVGFISPSLFGLHTSVMLLAMTVLGGTGSLAGPALAAAFFTMLPYADALIPGLPREAARQLADWETDIYGATIILVMLFAPGGIAGALRRLRARAGRRA